jgi:hypothetical protein
MERDSYRDGKSMHTDREVDINDGWAVTTRQGSEGGSSVVESNRQADGSITREGTITAADGRTAEISGERNNGVGSTTITGSQGGEATVDRTRTSQGVSREGSYTNASGDSIEGSTKRDGYQTKSELTSSKGGEAVSISQGSDRTTVAKSGEGDLYASHNGNIYKKGEGGWSGYDPESGNWNQMENRERGASTSRASSGNQVQSRDWENYSSQMNRDATTRQNSYNQFNQRATRSSGGRSRSRGFGRRR